MDSALAKQIGDKLDSWTTRSESSRSGSKKREKLPKRIAELAAEGRELLEKAGELTGDAARVPEKCLDEVGEQLAEAENRFSNVEYALDQLPCIDAEKTWVTTTVERFDSIWETMSPLNRGRLVKLLVKKVVVDEKREPSPPSSPTWTSRTTRSASMTMSTQPGLRAPIQNRRPNGGNPMKTEKFEQSTNEAGDIIFTGSFHRVRRGNKPITLESKPPNPVKPVRKPARVARILAFAHKVKQAIEDGEYEDQADTARQLGLTRTRVSQLIDLTWLSPSIQEEILFLELPRQTTVGFFNMSI